MFPIVSMFLLAGPSSGQWSLSTGTTVTLEILQPTNKQAWQVNGGLIDATPIYRDLLQKKLGLQGVLDRIVAPVMVVWTKHASVAGDMPNLRFKFPATGQIDFPLTALAHDNRSWLSASPVPAGQKSVGNLEIGVGDGPWKPAGWVSYVGGIASKHGGIQFGPKLEAAPTRSNPLPYTSLTVKALDALSNVAVRYVVRDTMGKELTGGGYIRPKGTVGVTTFFYVGDYRTVGRIELQTRPYVWTTLHNVHLAPN
jgi:hypothetical protein